MGKEEEEEEGKIWRKPVFRRDSEVFSPSLLLLPGEQSQILGFVCLSPSSSLALKAASTVPFRCLHAPLGFTDRFFSTENRTGERLYKLGHNRFDYFLYFTEEKRICLADLFDSLWSSPSPHAIFMATSSKKGAFSPLLLTAAH